MNHGNSSERRSSARFQGTVALDLEALIEVEEQHYWPVGVLNLSLEGALLETPIRKLALLPEGQEVCVKLSLESDAVWVVGTIQHVQYPQDVGSHYVQVGVAFHRPQPRGSKDAAQALGRMVRALDRFHLRRRALSAESS